jgi:hypothetical protein
VCRRTYSVHSTYVFFVTRATIWGKIVKPAVHYYDYFVLSLKLEPKSVRAPRTDVLLEGKVVFVQPES